MYDDRQKRTGGTDTKRSSKRPPPKQTTSKIRLAWFVFSALLIQRLFASFRDSEETESWNHGSSNKEASAFIHHKNASVVVGASTREEDPKGTANENNTAWTMNSWDGLVLSQETWRNWLGQQQQQTIVLEEFKNGTYDLEVDWCGFSLFFRYGTTEQRIFFKHASGNIQAQSSPWHVETHLREIKAAYLDRILGTQLIPACTGYRIPYSNLQSAFYKDANRHCFKTNNNGLVEGAAMFVIDGPLKMVPQGRDILQAAGWKRDSTEFSASARRYVMFLYLAGCAKSLHNHFSFVRMRVIALDNDRCFTPNQHLQAISQESRYEKWERIVFETCRYSDSLQSVLEEAENGERISVQLKRALTGDVLSEALLNEQPEVFEEIDERASRLLEHIQNCRNNSTGR